MQTYRRIVTRNRFVSKALSMMRTDLFRAAKERIGDGSRFFGIEGIIKNTTSEFPKTVPYLVMSGAALDVR